MNAFLKLQVLVGVCIPCHKSIKLSQKIQTHSERTGENNKNAKNSLIGSREKGKYFFAFVKKKRKLIGIPSASGSSV